MILTNLITRFYAIYNKNNKIVYIGVTLRPITIRFKEHIRQKVLTLKDYYVLELTNIKHPQITSLKIFYQEKDKVSKIEKKLIRKYKTKVLLNKSTGGEWGCYLLKKKFNTLSYELHNLLYDWSYNKSINITKRLLNSWISNKSKNKLKLILYSWIRHTNDNKLKKILWMWYTHRNLSYLKYLLKSWYRARYENNTKKLLESWYKVYSKNYSKRLLINWILVKGIKNGKNI